MSKKNRDKKKESSKETSQVFKTSGVFTSFWNEKKPVILFLAGFGLLMGIFYAFWFSEIFETNILLPIVKLNAVAGSMVLNLFGFGTQSNGTDIFSSSFTISVKRGCDAIEPIAIFISAVLLFPASFGSKGMGLLVGVTSLWLLNQVRIISLFMFGIYSPALFDIMHIQVWQAVFIAVTLVCLGYWIVWAMRKDKSGIQTTF